MRRYLLFAGGNYYPSPGFHAYIDSYDSKYAAYATGRMLVDKSKLDWWQVVDGTTGEIIKEGPTTDV